MQSKRIANAIHPLNFGKSKLFQAFRFRLCDRLQTSAIVEHLISDSGAIYTNQEQFVKFLNTLHLQMAIRASGTGP